MFTLIQALCTCRRAGLCSVVRLLVGWLFERLVGLLVGWMMVGWWLAGALVGRLADSFLYLF